MFSDDSPARVSKELKNKLLTGGTECKRGRSFRSGIFDLRTDLRDPVLLPIGQMLLENQ
jgi:hypothetical protein